MPRPAQGRLQLLDRFGFEWRGRATVLPRGSQRLLALLALAPDLPRSQVSCLLWPDLPRDRAPASLRTLTWRVRQQCPGLLVADGRTIRVGDGVDVDVRRLQENAARWREIRASSGSTDHVWMPDEAKDIMAWRSLLPGWYDDWVLFHRARLAALRVETLTQMAESLLKAGRHVRALDLALAAVADEPLDEALHVLVARIHVAQGNGAEALRQYQLCAALFRRELGIDPTPAFAAVLPLNGERAQPARATGPAPPARTFLAPRSVP